MGLRQFIAARLHPLPKRPVPRELLEDSPEDARHELGRAGEKLAVRYLRHLGIKPLYANFRGAKGGELDLVAREGKSLVFLEVKTRSSDTHSRPADAVGPAKQRLIARGAREWLRMLGNPPVTCRFDVLEIVAPPGQPPRFHLIRDAFEAPPGIQAELG